MPGIYIHIPFCKSKCSYCDFYSLADQKYLNSFLEALFKEISHKHHVFKDKTIKTIYFGGGTPSVLSHKDILRIFDVLFQKFSIDNNCEITFEANPDDLNNQYLRELIKTPINRISIGIQSSNKDILKLMRRRHDFETARSSIYEARELGFDNISIDMIYGIFGLSETDWSEQLDSVLSLPVEHLSAYHLGIEPKTLLYKKVLENKFQEIDEGSSFKQYKILLEKARKFNFEQYEISSFAKEGKQSKHNSSYWDRSEYLGFGPSAHSLLGNSRIFNIANIKEYISLCNSEKKMCDSEELTYIDIYNETIMLKLRTNNGLNLEEFMTSFGKQQLEALLKSLESINKSHYFIKDNKLSLTESGMIVSNNIICKLFKTE